MLKELINWEEYRRKVRILAYLASAAFIIISVAVAAMPSKAQENIAAQDYLPEVPQSLSGEIASGASVGSPCKPGALVRSVQTNKPHVALTFDDGPDHQTTAIMDALDQRGVKATFYMVGAMLRQNPQIARDVVGRGHLIGNHSMSHQYSPSIIASEIEPMNQLVQSITGVRPATFRSPGLTEGSVIQQRLAETGQCNVFTRFDIGDWKSPRISAAQICANIRNNVRAGDILLLHDGGSHAPTVQAAQTCIVESIAAKGLEIVPESDLLAGTDPIGSRVRPGEVIEIQAGQPNQTVVGQLTIDGALGSGYLQAYPCAEGRPDSSDLNYVANTATANLLFVKLDGNGKFCISVNVAATHVIYDQTAELSSEQLPLHAPVRRYDSRHSGGKLTAGKVLRLKLAEANQIVIGQITSDQAEGQGYITAYTCDTAQPSTSNLNFVPQMAVSNRYVAKANSDGEICFFTLATTHIIIDQTAELPADAMSFETGRLMDTRPYNLVPGNSNVFIQAGQPNQTVIGQLTIDGAIGNGYATVYPCASGVPTASHVNFTPARPRSSSVVVTTDSSGMVCAFVSVGTHVIFDKFAVAPWPSHSAVRKLDTRNL